MVEVPELLAGDGVARPAAAGAAGWVCGCRVIEEERLDGVAGGSEAAGDPRGKGTGGPGEPSWARRRMSLVLRPQSSRPEA